MNTALQVDLEHRTSCSSYATSAFFTIPQQMFKLIVDSIVWGIKHTMRHISDTGLTKTKLNNISLHLTALLTLLEMWEQISKHEAAQAFYQAYSFHPTFIAYSYRYFLSLLQDIFVVLTDTYHKSGFIIM